MGMLCFYKRIPASTMRKAAKSAIKQIEEWFRKNPSKTNCNAELFYGRRIDIKPRTVEQQVVALVEKLIAEEKAKDSHVMMPKARKTKK